MDWLGAIVVGAATVAVAPVALGMLNISGHMHIIVHL